ncbi:MAG: chemotaxis-specific protein-glutamate methyltransferase CheB [Ilumatobacteraceae bacterium]
MSSGDRSGPARVVVVEDSLVQRAKLVAVLESDGDITVIGEATTAVQAIAMVASLRPDVVTLDLNIPDGGGQYALEQIMANTPTPVLVLSSTVSDRTSAPAVEALVGGALLAVPKPMRWTPEFESELRRSVRMIRNVPVIRHIRGRLRSMPAAASKSSSSSSSSSSQPTSRSIQSNVGSCVVAIAASTGGPPALAVVLGGLSNLEVPVLIVQHIHSDFVQGLVDWMSRVSPLQVVLARHGDAMRGGFVHIAPGGTHLHIGRDWKIELVDRPVTVHRPSADQLFESVALRAGDNGVGVLLTGMGEDGAAGMAAMHRTGARTIAQDEATSAVYGMPRAAERLGVVDQQLPLPAIATAILRAVQLRTSARL